MVNHKFNKQMIITNSLKILTDLFKRPTPNIKAGQQAEQITEQFLIGHHLKLICRNYLTKVGEIDLIMLEDETVVFIEVRLRTNVLVAAIETVDLRKQKKIIKTAHLFLQNNPCYRTYPCRFDVVALDTLSRPEPLWLKDAFQNQEF